MESSSSSFHGVWWAGDMVPVSTFTATMLLLLIAFVPAARVRHLLERSLG